MIITIDIPDHEVEEFAKFMFYSKQCGTLTPDFDPIHRVGLRVIREIARQKKEKEDAKA